MPVNVSLMDALKKRYGKHGENIYYAKEQQGGKPFKKGLRTAQKEGHTVANLAAFKKRRSRGRK